MHIRVFNPSKNKMLYFKGFFNKAPDEEVSEPMVGSGIKDSLGNEIFEQDIIMSKSIPVKRWVIRSKSGSFFALEFDGELMSHSITTDLQRAYPELKVVGNYYQNPKIVDRWWKRSKIRSKECLAWEKEEKKKQNQFFKKCLKEEKNAN